MRTALLCLLLQALPFCLLAQTQKPASVETSAAKSATPIPTQNSKLNTQNSTRAVVVGISDYQDAAIPDLRFADRDAEAFANFLRSPAGGALDGDHLKVLTNRNATAAQFSIALDWLVEMTQEGDNAIIYFSGHGDVEAKRVSQPGYLLGWDAPSRVYMAGGAVNVRDLQDIISTLSTQNKARVVVITDACRSGKLSGSDINGAQLTGQNLARQFANEIKILSCQPNEYSIEGEQWGGGRGAFSFNLVDALYGLADGNNDLFVTLQEVGRYLEDHVTAEVAPVSQVPMVLGNRTERLAAVDAQLLADLRSGRTSQMIMISPVEMRGMEEEVLAGVDTTVRELYRLFKKALEEKVFLEPATACADAYYERLMAEPRLARLHSTMRRNYAAALQDEAQQTLNEWLKTRQEVSLEAVVTERLPQKVFKEKVKTYPRCLDRAAELLGSKHYMYAALKARRYFFEGYLLANSNKNPDQELGGRALALFRQSLEWQPEQPQVYLMMSQVFGNKFLQSDSLERYARRAIEIHPNWISPYIDAAINLSIDYRQFDRAKPFLEEAYLVDPNSADLMHAWAIFNNCQNRFAEAEPFYFKAIALDSTYAIFRNDLGALYLDTDRYAEAEQQLKKAVALDSTNAAFWGNLGYLYSMTGRYDEAESVLKKAIALDSTNTVLWINLGTLYLDTGLYDKAEQIYIKAIVLDSVDSGNWASLGYLYLVTDRYAEAEPVLKNALSMDSTNSTRWNNLGLVHLNNGRFAEAEPVLKKAIALDSTFANPRKHLGMVYFKTNRPYEARQNFLKAIELNPNYTPAMLGMAYFLASEGKTAEALDYVEQAIGKGITFEQLETDEDLAPLRALPEWKVLMKKYFPNQVKD